MIRRVLEAFALTAAYVAAGKLGLLLAFANENTSAVWPPAGIAVGCLLVLGRGAWPAVAVGAFLVNVTTSGRVAPSLLIAVGNTLEALAAWWLVRRYARGELAFDRAGSAFTFGLLAGAVAPTVAAVTGVAALRLGGMASPDETLNLLITWWLGDAVGIVLVAPVIVMWARPPRHRWTSSRRGEMTGVLVAVAVASWLVFGASPAGIRQFPIAFLAVPFLLWPAFRLGARETATATLLLAAIAIAGTVEGYGPFVRVSPNESLQFLQAFIGVWSMAMLAVSAEVETRERIESEIRGLNENLEGRVATRTLELSRMHDRLVEAQRVANFGSWEWDVLQNTIWWSDELLRMFKVPRSVQLTYESYLDLIHPEDRSRVESAVGKSMADHRPFSIEHRLIWPDGSVRTIQGEGHAIVDPLGNVVRLVGTARDITELRQADEARLERIREQAARIEAEDASRAKDEFLATLSHELRTPLNAALGWTQMLRDVLDNPPARTRAADAILRNLQAQSRLVSDMMDLSHITLRMLRLEEAPVNMVTVVRCAIESLRDPASARAIAITAILPDKPIYVLGDDGRLQQVVWNLLSNSAKFSREGAQVFVSLAADDAQVTLVVEDEGQGIEPAFLPHVFERFRQADPTVTRRHGGLGLGLAIARHLVEAHGGRIEARNRENGGAVFTVSLPVAPADVRC